MKKNLFFQDNSKARVLNKSSKQMLICVKFNHVWLNQKLSED